MNCACGRRAVYFRRFEGRPLCSRHFMRSVEKKAKRAIRHARIPRGGRIAVAVSGGKDSSVALSILNDVLSPMGSEVIAITVDEGIRGYRPANIRNARKLCKKLGVEHHVVSFKETFGKSLDAKVREITEDSEIKEPCTYCGVGRRYVLNRTAREIGAKMICTGHNLDDEVQSIMMNYMRGDLLRAGRMGLVTDLSTRKKLGEMFVPRFKPLREVPEKEVALYSILAGIESDWKECPHVSGIRFDVRDFVNDMEEKYPGIKYTVLHTFDRLLPCIRKVSGRSEGEIELCERCGEPGSGRICKACELWRA